MTFGELRFRLAKELPGVDPDKLDGWINDAYQDLIEHHAWKGLETSARLQTVAVYQVGTVDLVQGSTAITGEGTAWTEAMSGMKLKVTPDCEAYTFTYVSPTSGTLDRPFESESVSAEGYSLYQDVYPLAADYSKPVQAVDELLPMELRYMDLTELNHHAPARTVFGFPQIYSPMPDTYDPSGVVSKSVCVYPLPLTAAAHPYRYIRSIPLLDDSQADVQLLDFVCTSYLIATVRANACADAKDYNGVLVWEKAAGLDMDRMLRADARVRGPQKIRMAPRFTRHRVQRAMRSYPTRTGLVP